MINFSLRLSTLIVTFYIKSQRWSLRSTLDLDIVTSLDASITGTNSTAQDGIMGGDDSPSCKVHESPVLVFWRKKFLLI